MPNPSKTATTRKSTATRDSGARPAPGSGSVSPRTSAKARELAKKNKELQKQLSQEKFARQSAEQASIKAQAAKMEAERDLRKIADGFVQIDPMARRRRFVMEIDEHATALSYHSHDIYAMALKKLIQAMTEHHMANLGGVAEGVAREFSTKLAKREKAKTLMGLLGFNAADLRPVYMFIGLLSQWSREPMYRSDCGVLLGTLGELLNTGIDVVMEERHRRKELQSGEAA